MRKPNGSILQGIVLSSLTLAAGTAAAEVVDFQGMPSAVYGQANENTVLGACPTSGGTSCFVENGVAVGIVKIRPMSAPTSIAPARAPIARRSTIRTRRASMSARSTVRRSA